MSTNAAEKMERTNGAADRSLNPQQAFTAASQVNIPLYFGDFESDVPLMVGALAVIKARPPAWERHDHGDELLVVLSGHFTMALRDLRGELAHHEVKAGNTLLIPKGSAHMATLHSEEARVLFMTPRTGNRDWLDGETPPEHAPAIETYASLMRYKRWADEHLFAALLSRPNIESEPQAALIREIVGHFHVVDRIFQAHLQGVPHAFASTRLQGAPTLPELKDEVSAVDQWYVDYAESVGRDALNEQLSIRFTYGTRKVFTRAEVLLHIAQHGTYHRGNVGVLMHSLGMELPPDRFIDYVESASPNRIDANARFGDMPN